MLQLHCCIQTGQKQRWHEQLQGNPEEENQKPKLVCLLDSLSRKVGSAKFVKNGLKSTIKHVTAYCRIEGFSTSAEE